MKDFMESNQKRIRLDCDCMNIDHLLEFSYFDDETQEDPEDMLYFSSGLNADVPFWRRVYLGVRYIFRASPYKYAMFGETVLLPRDARAGEVLRELLDKL